MGLKAFFGRNGGAPDIHERYSKAKEDHSSLGNILVEKGYVSIEVLERAIKVQKSQSLLGRILVNMGAITEEELEDVLLEQKIRRKQVHAQEVIKSNSKKHNRLVDEVQQGFRNLDRKFSATVGKK